LARRLLGQFLGGQPAQLVVDQRQQLAGGVLVAGRDGVQDRGDVAHARDYIRPHRHPQRNGAGSAGSSALGGRPWETENSSPAVTSKWVMAGQAKQRPASFFACPGDAAAWPSVSRRAPAFVQGPELAQVLGQLAGTLGPRPAAPAAPPDR